MEVNNELRELWGSYKDRKNSYDDAEETRQLHDLYMRNKSFRAFLQAFFTKKKPITEFIDKPFGQFDIDCAIKFGQDDLILFEFERWKSFDPDWPKYYKWIHFLARKERLLEKHERFLFGAFSMDFSKLLVVDSKDIRKYPIQKKTFKVKEVDDTLRVLPLYEGFIFSNGGEITEFEKTLFRNEYFY